MNWSKEPPTEDGLYWVCDSWGVMAARYRVGLGEWYTTDGDAECEGYVIDHEWLFGDRIPVPEGPSPEETASAGSVVVTREEEEEQQ